MAERTSGTRYEAIKEALGKQSGISVIAETNGSNVNRREGVAYERTTILVAPNSDSSNISGLADTILDGVDRVSKPREEVIHLGEEGETVISTLRSFDRTCERSFHVTSVEVFPSQEQAQIVLAKRTQLNK